eukprot:3025961-Rhodomonas_salina.3
MLVPGVPVEVPHLDALPLDCRCDCHLPHRDPSVHLLPAVPPPHPGAGGRQAERSRAARGAHRVPGLHGRALGSDTGSVGWSVRCAADAEAVQGCHGRLHRPRAGKQPAPAPAAPHRIWHRRLGGHDGTACAQRTIPRAPLVVTRSWAVRVAALPTCLNADV